MKRFFLSTVICFSLFLPTFAQKNKPAAQLAAKEIGLATINRTTAESIIEFNNVYEALCAEQCVNTKLSKAYSSP